jgi:excisionase family DNA binding protein
MADGAKRRTGVSEPIGPAVEVFIDKLEVGRRLQVGVRTVEEWMSSGLLPYYKLGTTVRFKWSDVERHLDRSCRVAPRPSPKP